VCECCVWVCMTTPCPPAAAMHGSPTPCSLVQNCGAECCVVCCRRHARSPPRGEDGNGALAAVRLPNAQARDRQSSARAAPLGRTPSALAERPPTAVRACAPALPLCLRCAVLQSPLKHMAGCTGPPESLTGPGIGSWKNLPAPLKSHIGLSAFALPAT
jgi:hypothetical protein